MSSSDILKLHLRRQELARGDGGHSIWKIIEETKDVPACRTAILICDMWDKHWSRGASERVAAMAPRMNEVIKTARTKGVSIIHAPSDTLSFYEGSRALQKGRKDVCVELPAVKVADGPPLPIDDSDGGSDTNDGSETVNDQVWTRQIETIEIDDEHDVISDDGRQIYSFLIQNNIEWLIFMGVHTNMCVLDRSFGIKAMVGRGVDVALCRDLTDAMYNPARPPYVSHNEGTQLVIEYIEKFWSPTLPSRDLI